jgi:hypothetical protein
MGIKIEGGWGGVGFNDRASPVSSVARTGAFTSEDLEELAKCGVPILIPLRYGGRASAKHRRLLRIEERE